MYQGALSAYEQIRQRNIAENQAVMERLGLLNSSASLALVNPSVVTQRQGMTRNPTSMPFEMPQRHPHMHVKSSKRKLDELIDLPQKKSSEKLVVGDCSICLSLPSRICFIPCGHLCACSECSKKIAECPICREDILGKMTVYAS